MAKRKNSLLASVSYFVFFLPLFGSGKKDMFVKYHMNQSAWLLVIILALQGILSLWGYWNFPLLVFLKALIRILIIIGVTSGVLTAIRGEEKPLPVVGKFAPKFF